MEIPEPYLRIIHEQMSDTAGKALRLNRDGLVNDVVIVDETWVFRFPKTEEDKRAQQKESRILDVVRQYVDMPVPAFILLSDSAVMYPIIPGVPLDRNKLLHQTDAVQAHLAEQIAQFLRQMHSIPVNALTQHDISVFKRDASREAWVAKLEEIQRELFPLLWADQKAWVVELFAPVLAGELDMQAYSPSLTHYDLASYHILFDEPRGVINGVIDFGVAGITDPANDMALLINILGEHFLQRMQPHYPDLETMLDRARFMAGVLELQWVLEGLRSKDLSWFTVHLGRARDVKPIGMPLK